MKNFVRSLPVSKWRTSSSLRTLCPKLKVINNNFTDKKYLFANQGFKNKKKTLIKITRLLKHFILHSRTKCLIYLFAIEKNWLQHQVFWKCHPSKNCPSQAGPNYCNGTRTHVCLRLRNWHTFSYQLLTLSIKVVCYLFQTVLLITNLEKKKLILGTIFVVLCFICIYKKQW